MGDKTESTIDSFAYRNTPYAYRAFSTQFPALQRVSGVETVKNYINGKFTESKTDKWIELRNPVRHLSCMLVIIY